MTRSWWIDILSVPSLNFLFVSRSINLQLFESMYESVSVCVSVYLCPCLCLCLCLFSGPFVALVLEKEDAVDSWKALLGPKEVEVAQIEAPERCVFR